MSREQVKQSAREAAEVHLQELRVDSLRQPRDSVREPRRHSERSLQREKTPKLSSRSTDYSYVNPAYVGSTNNVAEARNSDVPVTSEVIREQYWACSKWPLAQRILAIAVGILMGTIVGLVVTMVVKGKTADEVIGGILNPPTAPD